MRGGVFTQASYSKRLLLIVFVVLSLFISIVYANRVEREVTSQDIVYIKKILHEADYKPQALKYSRDYQQQLHSIMAVQEAVFETTPETAPIPPNQTREPEDLYKFNSANCSDRSRFMDKALRYLGFRTRYAFIAGTSHIHPFRSESGPASHALIEVKTAKGWLFVDSVSPWIALKANRKPVSLEEWRGVSDKTSYPWKQQQDAKLFPLLMQDFYPVYGLYSLHGRFYPPYWPFPDINWYEFMYNITI